MNYAARDQAHNSGAARTEMSRQRIIPTDANRLTE